VKFKVFDVPWHIGHQYEMLKFPFVDWYWLRQPKRHVGARLRGSLDGKVTWVEHYEPGRYDAAILHLDQECLDEIPTRLGKDSYYRHLDRIITDIPKIVVMHGTPCDPEMHPDAEELVRALHGALGDNILVVNSHRAAEQWRAGRVIIHGMESHEWFDLPKEPRVVTVLSPQGMNYYYDRPFLSDIRAALARRNITHCHISVDFVANSWDDYRDFLGRSLIYLNPTRESPMPRARTEAMFSGCCVLTTPFQDASRFIVHGRNGFLIQRDPEAVAGLIEHLLSHPREAIAIGAEGKRTAQQIFTWDRYASQWRELLETVVGQRARPRAIINFDDAIWAVNGYGRPAIHS
jgi:glycosyltransferase involved in cell wall biosynthesis